MSVQSEWHIVVRENHIHLDESNFASTLVAMLVTEIAPNYNYKTETNNICHKERGPRRERESKNRILNRKRLTNDSKIPCALKFDHINYVVDGCTRINCPFGIMYFFPFYICLISISPVAYRNSMEIACLINISGKKTLDVVSVLWT